MRRRLRRDHLAVIPNLITLGNLVCGFAAITRAAQGRYAVAGWFILLGMVFDMLDGRVARMTRSQSDLGEQLDSLADAVTFGIAPATLVALASAQAHSHPFWPRIVWFFSLLFAVCAVLRLARFNLANLPEAEAHQSFKGLPSPGGAGVIASLLILQGWLQSDPEPRFFDLPEPLVGAAAHGILKALPFAALVLGYLMVSTRVPYVHVANRYIGGRRTFEYIADIAVLLILGAVLPQVALALVFIVYAVSGPIGFLRSRLVPRRAEAPAPRPGRAPDRPLST